MTLEGVLLPVAVYALLVFGLLGGLVVTGTLARRPALPDQLRRQLETRASWFGASYSNQFELPVLFLALVAFGLASGRTDGVFIALEWLFVAARFAHALVHVTVNIVPVRGLVFMVGVLILAAAWIRFVWEVLAAS